MSQKYPDPINGFDFIIGRGGKPTYRLNKKMTSAEKVPEEVKAQLLTQYEQLSAQRAAENAAAEAAEAAKNADEIVHAVDFAGDTLDEVEIAAPEIPLTPAAQSVIDTMPTPSAAPQYTPPQVTIDSEPRPRVGYPAGTLAPGVATYEEMSPEERAILDSYPTDPTVQPGTVPMPSEPVEHFSVTIEAQKQELERRKNIIEELMKGSVYEADLQTLAEQLAERFNIYTVFIGREPNDTDLHPITAEVMNNFDRGLAYKQYVRATLSGTLGQIDRTIAVAQSNPRFERPQAAQVQPLPPQAQTLQEREQSHLNGEIKNAESYGIDGIIQDPPVMANGFARQIVDPSWLNKAKTIDQFDLENL